MEDNNINQENIDQNTNQNYTQNAEKLQEISDIYNSQFSNGGENVVLVNRSPIDYYILAFQKYGQFSGRATRNEYWWFYLVNLAVTFLLAIIESVFSIPFTLLSTIYFFASIVPSLSIQVRRLHDVDKSGWYMLLNFVIIIGWIWLLVLNILDSTPGSNKYGPNPKVVQA
ncbi:MAG: hypothetical protein RJB24_608 [Candidatus Parcubacteria bacterium]|jgi:uncharacterized membrane protein YhaH (DUF805 family)